MVALVWTIGVLLGLAGLALLLCAFIRKQTPAGACARCGYDRRGTPRSPCPECGGTKPPRTTTRRRRLWLLVPGLVCVVPLLGLWFPGATSRVIRFVVPYWKPDGVTRRRGVVLRRFRQRAAPAEWINPLYDQFGIDVNWEFGRRERLRLESENGVLMDCEGDSVTLLAGAGAFSPTKLTRDDLDGDGTPDLVLEWHSLQAPKYPDLLFVRLGPRARVLGRVRRVTNVLQFQIVDGDGSQPHITINTGDPIWQYWKCCGACSPDATVVLEYLHGSVRLGARRMYLPLPDVSSLRTQAEQMRSRFEAEKFSQMFWGPVIDLVYSGHPKAGIQMLRHACTNPDGTEDAFVVEFVQNLHTSVYWPAMVQAWGDENAGDDQPPSQDPIIKLLPTKP